MLAIIIPARNEIYLEKTIQNILANAEGEIEVFVMLDGYLPDPKIETKDNRVTFYHYKESIGQRKCVNEGAKLAKGKYIMKLDAHCALDKGFDVKLAADCEYDWTVVPRMYNLDVETWQPKKHKLTDYMYITSPNVEKSFRADYYIGPEYARQHAKIALIDDTMACMGPCWFMHKDRFFEQGGCDEGHGGWGAMSVEVACKAWLSGGALKVNKKTWFAHWFRGDVGFPYQISGNDVEKARAYSRDLWLNNKWPKATRKFEWLIDKFQPPTWEMFPIEVLKNEVNRKVYSHILRNQGHYPTWRGIKIIKFPTDLILYEQAIWQNKPDVIIECGTAFGGSALFYADMLDIVGKGQVISIDQSDRGCPEHPRVTYLIGPTTDSRILAEVKEMVKGKTCMLILDSDHHRAHVKRELYYYSPFVTKGQYIVVEDIWVKGKAKDKEGPSEAVEWFLNRYHSFKRVPIDNQFLLAITRDGWLQKQ